MYYQYFYIHWLYLKFLLTLKYEEFKLIGKRLLKTW